MFIKCGTILFIFVPFIRKHMYVGTHLDLQTSVEASLKYSIILKKLTCSESFSSKLFASFIYKNCVCVIPVTNSKLSLGTWILLRFLKSIQDQ